MARQKKPRATAAAEEADARHDRGRRHRLAGVPGQPGRRREVDRRRPGARRPGPGAGRARPPGRDGGDRLRDHGDFVAGGIRPRLVQLFAGGDEVAVADLELTGFAPIACLADVGCVAYGAGFEARVFMGQGLEPRLNDAALAAGLRLDRDAFQRDLATTWRRIKRKPTPTNKKAMQRSDFSGELTPEQIAYAGVRCDHGLPGVGSVSGRGAVPALRDRQGRDPGRGIDGDGRSGIRPRRARRHLGRMELPGAEGGAPLPRDDRPVAEGAEAVPRAPARAASTQTCSKPGRAPRRAGCRCRARRWSTGPRPSCQRWRSISGPRRWAR